MAWMGKKMETLGRNGMVLDCNGPRRNAPFQVGIMDDSRADS